MEALRRKAWEGTTRVQNVRTGVYGNDAMLRQVAESVKINRVAKGSLINTKKEWNYVRLPRVVLDQGEM